MGIMNYIMRILSKIQNNLIIDTWLCCHVFDRQIENFLFNQIIKLAKV